jgi:hypothetical protein
MTTRREVLEDFQYEMKKLDKFLGECGQDTLINMVDPDQAQVVGTLAKEVENTLAWVSAEIKVELEKEYVVAESDLSPDLGAAFFKSE